MQEIIVATLVIGVIGLVIGIALVAAGLGICIMPELVMNDIPYEVHRYPMMPEAYRVIGISALNPNFLAPAVKMLYQHVVEKYKTIEEA